MLDLCPFLALLVPRPGFVEPDIKCRSTAYYASNGVYLSGRTDSSQSGALPNVAPSAQRLFGLENSVSPMWTHLSNSSPIKALSGSLVHLIAFQARQSFMYLFMAIISFRLMRIEADNELVAEKNNAKKIIMGKLIMKIVTFFQFQMYLSFALICQILYGPRSLKNSPYS